MFPDQPCDPTLHQIATDRRRGLVVLRMTGMRQPYQFYPGIDDCRAATSVLLGDFLAGNAGRISFYPSEPAIHAPSKTCQVPLT